MPKRKLLQDVHYYLLEDGKMVFTEKYHTERGKCCGSKCRHCPFEPSYKKGSTTIKEHGKDINIS